MAVVAVFSFSSSFSQGLKLGIHGNLSEYDGDLINKKSLYKFKHINPGFGVSFQEWLNSSFDLEQRYTYANIEFDDVPASAFRADFHALNLSLRYKMDNGYLFNKDASIAPFLNVGAGGAYIKSNRMADDALAFNFTAGGGLFFRFNDRVGMEVASNINWPQNDSWDGVTGVDKYNDIAVIHSLGLIFNLKKAADTDGDGIPDKRDKCPDTPPGVTVDSKGCPFDTDGDGVPDYLDQCKNEKGTAALNGCPDRDGDGIADKDDACPDVPGLARFKGCPDTDGDGIPDAEDRCPNVKGLDIFQGCPDTDGDGVEDALDKCPDTERGIKVDANGCPADTDGDGVIDSKDKCPTTPGDPANNGCPVIKEAVKKRLAFAARSINFETGKATLKTTSYPMLDEIIAILNEYKDYDLRIGGHTDNVGKEESNLLLSQARVDAVKSYLTVKGQIPDSRLEAIGYGQTRPIATNKTAAGKAQNRRVELELFIKDAK